MKKVNVYTYYDNTKTVIARIIPRSDWTITKETYNKLIKRATIGNACIYTDAERDIKVVGDYTDELLYIKGNGAR